MDRAFSSGASGTPPSAPGSPSTGYATSGNPGTGTPATKPGAWWYHMVTEELRALIVAAGLTPTHTNTAQISQAVQAMIAAGVAQQPSAAAAGTADAITATFTPGITVLKNGMALYVRGAAANATTTPTFTPASGTIAAKSIVKGAGAALAAGDIAGAGHWIELQYDLTLDKWVLLNPATGVTAPVAPLGQQVGEVCLFARNTAPTGFLKANGALVSRISYSALFSAIGTTFGVGDGSTTFGLPDLRGEFLRCWDDGFGVDPGRVFGSFQADDFKSHTHGIGSAASLAGGGGGYSQPAGATTSYLSTASGGTETRPRNRAMLACIKF